MAVDKRGIFCLRVSRQSRTRGVIEAKKERVTGIEGRLVGD